MAKDLKELAAERGFIEAEKPVEHVQEVIQDTQKPQLTPAEIYDSIPAEAADNMIKAAANISGIPAADLTLEKALKILEGRNHNPAIDAELDRISEETIAEFENSLTDEQIDALNKAAESGEMQETLKAILQKMAAEQTTALHTVNERAKSAACIAAEQTVAEQEAAINAAMEAISNGAKAMDSVLNNNLISNISKIATTATRNITNFINSDGFKAMQANIKAIGEFIEANRDLIEAAAETAEDLRELIPFMQIELEGNPKYKDIPLKELLKKGFDENGNPADSEWEQILKRAKERQAAYYTEIGVDLAEEPAPTINEIVEVAAALPMLQAIAPERHMMPNNALMNALQEGVKHSDGSKPAPIINAGEFDLTVSKGKGRRKDITAYTMIQYDNPESGVPAVPFKLTEYERQISDAVISISEKAKADNLPCIFTTDMIYRAMPGGGEKASPQQKGAITKAINKYRALLVYIDVTEEARRRGIIGESETLIYNDNYFHIEAVQVSNGKQTIDAFHLIKKPVILEYAQLTKQILTVPVKYIEIKKIKKGAISTELLPMSADRQAITGYLLRQIAWIKYDRNNKVSTPRSDTIRFDTVFNDAGINTTSRTTLNRQRDFIFSVLDYEKAAGYISDYEKLTKGKSIYGVKIKP